MIIGFRTYLKKTQQQKTFIFPLIDACPFFHFYYTHSTLTLKIPGDFCFYKTANLYDYSATSFSVYIFYIQHHHHHRQFITYDFESKVQKFCLKEGIVVIVFQIYIFIFARIVITWHTAWGDLSIQKAIILANFGVYKTGGCFKCLWQFLTAICLWHIVCNPFIGKYIFFFISLNALWFNPLIIETKFKRTKSKKRV